MPIVSDSPFYRVTAKALIFDSQNRLLVLRNHNGDWELPGGGWEHHESFKDCLAREITEELGVKMLLCSDVLFMYKGYNQKRQFTTLRIVAAVHLDSHKFTLGEDMQEYKYVDRDTFLALDMSRAEGSVHEWAHIIWRETSRIVEKTPSNL